MMKLYMLINSLYLMMMECKVNGTFLTRHFKYPLIKLIWRFTSSTKLKMILFEKSSKEYLKLPELLFDYGTFLEMVAGILNKTINQINVYDPVMKVMIYKDEKLKSVNYIEYVITLDTEKVVALNVRKRDRELILTIITKGDEFVYDAQHSNQQYIIIQEALDRSIRTLIHMTIKKIFNDIHNFFWIIFMNDMSCSSYYT